MHYNQTGSFILPYLFLIERVLPRHIWQLEILVYVTTMDLPSFGQSVNIS